MATYDVLTLTGDESPHLARGLEYLSKHVYVYETQHPPLARAMDALGPYLAGALAALSRFTALGYLPAAAVLALLAYVAVEKPGMSRLAALARERAAVFPLAAVTGALVIWAAYWFSVGKVPGWNLSLPAPEFLDGVLSAIRHSEAGHEAYLPGQVSMKGWRCFFP